jgi:hypothetical protein
VIGDGETETEETSEAGRAGRATSSVDRARAGDLAAWVEVLPPNWLSRTGTTQTGGAPAGGSTAGSHRIARAIVRFRPISGKVGAAVVAAGAIALIIVSSALSPVRDAELLKPSLGHRGLPPAPGISLDGSGSEPASVAPSVPVSPSWSAVVPALPPPDQPMKAAKSPKVDPPIPAPLGPPGLTGVGYWPLDQVNGATTPDVPCNGCNATLVNGPTLVAGRTGNALRFNGSNQYVDTGASILDTTGNYSVSAWVEIDHPGDNFETAVSQDGSSGHSEFYLQYSGDDHVFAFSFVRGRALAPSPPQPGVWYHLVGVRNVQQNQMRLYVNGQLAGTVAYWRGDAAPGHTLIGRARFNNTPADFWEGRIDQVHVYDYALSADEIATLYTSGR